MKKLLFIAICLLFFTLIKNVYAQNCSGIRTPGQVDNINSQSNCFTSPASILNVFLPYILGILGFITVIMIVISGIQFITSSGNPESAGAARGRLTYAIIGFILVLVSYAVLQIVNWLFLNTQLT